MIVLIGRVMISSSVESTLLSVRTLSILSDPFYMCVHSILCDSILSVQFHFLQCVPCHVDRSLFLVRGHGNVILSVNFTG